MSNTTIPPNRKDIAWNYATLIDPKNPNVVNCICCGKTANGVDYVDLEDENDDYFDI